MLFTELKLWWDTRHSCSLLLNRERLKLFSRTDFKSSQSKTTGSKLLGFNNKLDCLVGFRVILRFTFTKTAITQPKLVQILKFWYLNASTSICPSCGNIHSIKIMIYKELTGEDTFKTFNFRPNFCIKSHIFAHNSQEGPWSYLMSHTPEKLLPIRFQWCITLAWVTQFLLSSFLASVLWECERRIRETFIKGLSIQASKSS